MKTQQKLTKNWKGLTESMLYQGQRFLGGIKHFWMAVRMWKTNLVLEDLVRKKQMKMWPKWGISWGLIDIWQSEWSVVCSIWIAKLSTKFWPSNWVCGHLDATSRQCSPSHCHLHERIFGQKRVFQWFRGHHTRLTWVRVTSCFSPNSNSTSKVVILELWTIYKRSWQTCWGHFYIYLSVYLQSTHTRLQSIK